MARAALALPFSGLSGRLGDTIVSQLPDGPTVRRRTPVRKGKSPAQEASEARMREVSRIWARLDDRTYGAWETYALTRTWRNAATGAIVQPKAFNLFCGLAIKLRQVDPLADLLAFRPPVGPFFGDAAEIGVAADPDGAGLIFSSSAPNAPGVVTELLVQPLAHRRRKAYGDKYASVGFVAFAGGSARVTLPAGAYACAYRYVRLGSGQETALATLGAVDATP